MEQRTRLALCLLLLPLVIAAACDARSGPSPGPSARPEEAPARPAARVAGAVATVNGVPITEADVQLLMSSAAHGRELTPEQRQNVLHTIVRQELGRQQAVKLGLDRDPALAARLGQAEAQANALRRRLLYEALVQQEVDSRTAISDEEASAYFQKNGAMLGSRLHIWQILTRDEATANKALEQLKAGRPFDEVARASRPDLPAATPPFWDLGLMRWTQMPAPWREALGALAKGEHSGVIRGPGNRFWVLRLVDRVEAPAAGFEAHKAEIVETLKRAKVEQGRQELESRLLAGARVVYSDKP